MRIANTGLVGIGTNTPQYELDVNAGNGAGTFQASFGGTINNTDWTGIHFGYSQKTNANFRKSAIVFERLDDNFRGKIHILNDGAADSGSAVLADSRLTIDSSGNVGIGTTSPSTRLHVIGDARIGQVTDNSTAARLDITAGGSGSDSIIDLGFWGTFDAAIWHIKRHGADGSFRIANSSSGSEAPVFTIVNSNLVGIGTTNPRTTLEVTNGILMPTNGGYYGGGAYWDGSNWRNTTNSQGGWVIRNTAGELAIHCAASPGTAGSAFSTFSERMRIAGNGNVGIGTDIPRSILTLTRSGNNSTSPADSASIVLTNRNTSINGAVAGGIFIDTYRDVADPHYSGGIWFTRNQEVSNLSSSSDIVFGTMVSGGTALPSERMRLTSTGNLGIGISPNATARLDVNGRTAIRGSSTIDVATPGTTAGQLHFVGHATADNAQGITWGWDGVTDAQAGIYVRSSGSYGTRMYFATTNAFVTGSQTAMTILENANVGIGITTPQSRLHVAGIQTIVQNADAAYSLWKDSTPSIAWQYSLVGNNSGIRYYNGTSWGDIVRFTTDGNVGIGTDSPAYKLHVAGQSWFSNTMWFGSGGYISWTDSYGQGVTQTFASPGSSGTMALLTNGSTAVFIRADQSVGIGTNTPNYKLEVNGSFAATTKSFVINHPTKPGMKLRYGSLEGPENGVYVRGRLKDNNVIELPDYWTGLVDEDTITVNLTSIGKYQKLYVEDIKDNRIYVGIDNVLNKNIDCFYIVYAERKDVEKLEVELIN
jgi:hypothetical protein